MATLHIDALLQKVSTEDAPWSLKDQVEALKNWYNITGIKYALDERLAEAAVLSDELYSQMTADPKPCQASESY